MTIMRPEGLRHFLKASPTRPGAAKRPLVIVLHGSGASAQQVLGMAFPPSPLSVWRQIAEREQLVVIAPDGSKRRGRRCWNDSFADVASNPPTDDTAFIGALIDQAIADDNVDPARVFVMGVSKGGMLAYRLATEMGQRLAGFCAVLASMPVNSSCGLPTVAVPALLIAGTADPFIPYDGGKFPYTLWFTAPMLGVEASAAIWRELAGLAPDAAVSEIAPAGKGKGKGKGKAGRTRAVRHLWGADPAALQVGLIRIDGGGHAEPSRLKRYPGLFGKFPGAQNADVEVAEEAWAFFKSKRSGLQPMQPICA